METENDSDTSTFTIMAKSINLLLQNIPQMQAIYCHTDRLQQITRRLSEQLGPPINSHFSVANIQDDKLVLQADSAVWATRLRHHTPEIIAFARSELGLPYTLSLQLTVVPKHGLDANTTAPPRLMSAQTASYIKNYAQHIPHNGIRVALTRIAQNIQK